MPELSRPRVLHIITGLDTGGAENMLFKLLQVGEAQVVSRVVSLTDGGSNRTRIEALDVVVDSLGIGQGWLPGLGTLLRLRGVVREFAPDVIQGWMYHGNLAAWLAARLAPGHPRLAWNIRQTLYDPSQEAPLTRLVIRMGARLSPGVDAMVYNSKLSASQHQALGYAGGAATIIPNGFDLQTWAPDLSHRKAIRTELGLAEDAILIGHVARYHPMKGHYRLLEAAAILAARNARLHWLMVGRGVTTGSLDLVAFLREHGLEDRVTLAGERPDIPRIMCALDLLVSPSEWGEGFPNVLGEALATGVPCVATDIGDSAQVVGDCGRVVAPGDTAALAAALGELAGLSPGERAEIGACGREHVRRLFSIKSVRDRYLDLYRKGTV